MPWTLYRYILADLLRIIGLTTAVLVTVIAFGATIKPLASDRLLDAAQTARYIGLIIVPMLQFALPFAAGFGATMAFFRMVGDNEIQAMAASGISYRRILMPVFAFGGALVLVMIVLTQFVIPQFWVLLMHNVAADATQMFQASIARKEAFQLDKKLQIYADEIVVAHSPEGDQGPALRMTLFKVAAADLDDSGRLVTDVTARQATVDVYRNQLGGWGPGGGQMLVKLVMHDAVALNVDTGQLVQSDRFSPTRAIVIDSPVAESAKALSLSRMAHLWFDPSEYGPVQRARAALAEAWRAANLRSALASRLREHGWVEFIESPTTSRRSIRVMADQLNRDGEFERANSPIEVIQLENGEASLRFTANEVQLELARDVSTGDGRIAFNLVLGPHDVMNVHDPAGGVNRRGRLVLPQLMAADVDDEAPHLLDADALVAATEGGTASPFAADPAMTLRVAKLRNETSKLKREIVARVMNRLALALTAPLLLMLGAVMALWLRGSLPLATYAWAFVPAVVSLVVISAGEQILRDGHIWGHAVMWSGHALMLGLIASVVRVVCRN